MGPIKGIKRGKYQTRTLHPGKQVQCWKCNASYKHKYALLDHIRVKHLNEHVICSVCNKAYISVSVLNRHMKEVHNIKDTTIHCKLESNPYPASQATGDTSLPFENIEFDTNKAHPSMANVLSLKKNKVYGEHIISEIDIDVGHVILVTQAFASIEYLSSIDSSCFNCRKVRNNFFLECPFCINVRFCSRRCSLNEIHSSKCNRTFHRNDNHIVRLTTEIIRVALEKFSDTKTFIDFCQGILFLNKKHSNCQPPFSSYGELLRLKGIIRDEHLTIAHRVMKCIKLMPEFESFNSPDLQRLIFNLACRHISTIELNSFSEEFEITKGGTCTRFFMYDILSRFNHSCIPNVHHFKDDNNIVRGVTVRPIKKGDQIFINYLGSLNISTQERRNYIVQHWKFVCECEKCGSSPCDKENIIDSSYQYIQKHELNSLMNERISPVNKRKLKQECIQYLRKYGSTCSSAVDFVVRFFSSLINVL